MVRPHYARASVGIKVMPIGSPTDGRKDPNGCHYLEVLDYYYIR